MRIFCLALLLLTTSISSAQTITDSTYNALSDTAWSAYQQKDFARALQIYQQLIEGYDQEQSINHYNAACCAALSSSIDQAFHHLEESVALGFWERRSLIETDTDLDTLRSDSRFAVIMQEVNQKMEQKLADIHRSNRLLTHQSEGYRKEEAMQQQLEKLSKLSGEALYQQLSQLNLSNPIQTDSTQHFCLWLTYLDSIEIPYLIQLPAGFSNQSPHPLFIQLHGGIRQVREYPTYLGSGFAQGWNRYFSKYANQHGFIAVYPIGTNRINWMYPDQGFDLIPEIIRQLKLYLNIDDDRIFLCGHSNGATGSFSYAVKNPSPFAGFFGLNTHPQVYTGGTFILNLKNSYFHAISTDKDYYYPLDGIDSLLQLSQTHQFNFTNETYVDFPHWFPEFDESEIAIQKLFEQAANTNRSLPKQLYWECDDTRHGSLHWLSIETLEITSSAAPWHEVINFEVGNWVDVQDENKILANKTEAAFKFPRVSGAVKATCTNNTFRIETSRVGQIRLRIHPELIDLTAPVTVVINGKERWSGKVDYDDELMLKSFEQDRDRRRVWVNELNFEIQG